MRVRVLIASDHAGFELKKALQKALSQYEWIDLGPKDGARVDYPDFADALARKVAQGETSQGILICGSGIGMSIAANKVAGIRAAVVENPIAAKLAREHNNANILCLGARFLAPEYAAEIAQTWLESTFDPKTGGGRHQTRIEKISKLENQKPEK